MRVPISGVLTSKLSKIPSVPPRVVIPEDSQPGFRMGNISVSFGCCMSPSVVLCVWFSDTIVFFFFFAYAHSSIVLHILVRVMSMFVEEVPVLDSIMFP